MFTLDQEERRKRQYQQKTSILSEKQNFPQKFPTHSAYVSCRKTVTCGHTQLQKRLGKARKKGVEIGHWLG